MDRFTWGIVVGAVLLVAVGLASVTVFQRPPAPPDLSMPDGVVRAYVTAIETQHPEQAWDLLTTGARGTMTRDEFIRRASGQGRPRSGRVAIDSAVVEGNTARVELSRTYEGGGLFGPSTYISTNTVRLEREGGQWRISVPPDPYLLDRPIPPPAVVTVVVTPPAVTSTATPTPTR